ncbi:glycosyl hydrolase [Holotrichia oblita]|uniref:Glycosyl hydrolase n=1 Tax=Holotrichia oblita TaxID=644536 RepID=A0ACB9TIH2_HOLOL|nr:glycosyl hydrolase [Holotrichia oblita]
MRLWLFIISYFSSNTLLITGEKLNTNAFPNGFLFGVTSSAYQIEGSWNEDGKSPNIWDKSTHDNPEKILDKSNADTSCNSYKNYKSDIKALKDLNAGVYKFSLSMSRVVPFGKMNHVGLEYYNRLIDELVAINVKPMVTLFHWDTPEDLQKMGGWTNPFMVKYFVEYARIAFETFGDRVKYWITFNDPFNFCLRSSTDRNFPPYDINDDRLTYLCSYVVLKAHGDVYRLYNNSFKHVQNGLLSISLESPWFEPASTKQSDITAAEALFTYTLRQFADPIFNNGQYPTAMQEDISRRSLAEGYLTNRLPKFTSDETAHLRNSADFFALNFNTEIKVYGKNYKESDPSSIYKDASVEPIFKDDLNVSSSWIKVVPEAFRKILIKIKEVYKNVPIYITECGFPDGGESEDYDRIQFHQLYLSALLESIYEDNVTIIGYNVRSLMDCFEWNEGYTTKFGLYQINDKTRIPKLSSVAFKEIIHNRKLPADLTKKP